ncbi:hypothetical protein R1flu_007094 [Riccia fluitans]|uniref:Uncharacterized protein n=1 Tax=Riccia fluitans TaxID=41844 RepID=A0ABD1YXV7_9MARC
MPDSGSVVELPLRSCSDKGYSAEYCALAPNAALAFSGEKNCPLNSRVILRNPEHAKTKVFDLRLEKATVRLTEPQLPTDCVNIALGQISKRLPQ